MGLPGSPKYTENHHFRYFGGPASTFFLSVSEDRVALDSSSRNVTSSTDRQPEALTENSHA